MLQSYNHTLAIRIMLQLMLSKRKWSLAMWWWYRAVRYKEDEKGWKKSKEQVFNTTYNGQETSVINVIMLTITWTTELLLCYVTRVTQWQNNTSTGILFAVSLGWGSSMSAVNRRLKCFLKLSPAAEWTSTTLSLYKYNGAQYLF